MNVRPTISAGEFVDNLLATGRYTFTRAEARQELGATAGAVYMALHRLVKAGRLVMPRSGFYVIVDPQHRSVGTLPPEWFIDELMKNMGKQYYVGLLSAAQSHGAAHHRPQEFQVIVPTRAVRPIRVGNVHIRFFGKGPFDRSVTVEVKTPTGFQKASSAETTAWDLVRYPRAAGGLEHVITVLAELAERLDAAKLTAIVKRHGEILVAQRLGYLLDRLSRRKLTRGLADWVDKKDPPLRPLDPASPVGDGPESRKWRLLVNAKLEPEG